jgi:DNA-directed RNA polymerase subunit RPC12/RpoP
MAVKCTRCGSESELEKIFSRHKKSFSRTVEVLCPECASKRTLKDQQFAILVNCCWGLLGLVLVVFAPQHPLGWLLLNLFTFYIASVLVVLPHELGHAFAARMLGFRVYSVSIGVGRKVWHGKLFGFEVIVNSLPTGGLTSTAPRDLNRFRLRYFGVVGAGPLVNIFIALLIVAIVPAKKLWLWTELSSHFEPVTIFHYANLCLLAHNLWPHKVSRALGGVGSDGKQLLTIPFLKEEALHAVHAAYFVYESSYRYIAGDINGTEEWVDRGLTVYPRDRNLLLQQGTCFLQRGRCSEARERYVWLLTWPAVTPVNRALLMNNLAYTNVLLNRDDLLPEADRYSQEAMATLSAVPEIKGTRGIVLCALGRLEEGMPLLEFAFKNVKSIYSRAENACHIAMIESRRGNPTVAAEYLAIARKLNPNCLLISRAEAAVANVAT